MTGRTIKDVFDTFRRGDRLDDCELDLLREQMRLVANATADLGDTFLLASVYARQVEIRCLDIARLRSVNRQGAEMDPSASQQ